MSDGKFDLDGHCLSQEHPWSILDLSLPNAQLAGLALGIAFLVRSSIFIFQLGHRLGAEEGQCRLTE